MKVRSASLDSFTLHFDFFGRLTAIEVTGDGSVLPPRLIDDEESAAGVGQAAQRCV